MAEFIIYKKCLTKIMTSLAHDVHHSDEPYRVHRLGYSMNAADRGSISEKGGKFSLQLGVQTGYREHPASCMMVSGFCCGVKYPGRGAD